MRRFVLNSDPMQNDPGRWGHSLANLAELWVAALDAAQARSVVEVGAYAGDTTRILLDWAAGAGARVVAIDPEPQAELERCDAVILDGDHNYHTVSEELRLLEQRGSQLPLVICHDACWPHGRRDAYYDIEQIPAERRQPTVELGHLFPGDPGIHDGGLLFFHHRLAVREGGPGNGVLTAIEDFVHARPELELAVVPAFFGLAVVWPRSAAYAPELAAALAPYREHPVIARLEANRVLNLARWEAERSRVERERQRLQARGDTASELLARLLASRALTVASWLSRLHRRGAPAISKEEIRRALES